jgi:hypothetical protein
VGVFVPKLVIARVTLRTLVCASGMAQPDWMQRLSLVLPSRHFVAFAQAILYRGAGLETVCP